MNPHRCLLILLLVMLAGCPRRGQVKPYQPPDANSGIEQALADIAARRFKQAQEVLTFIIFNYPGSQHAADAQYYLAESYLLAGDYTQAQTEFEFYKKNFPNGRFQEETALRLAIAYLRSAPPSSRDQSRALRAQELLNEFLEEYPQSRFRAQAESLGAEIDLRLAEKELAAARLYFKAGEYRSALVYYEYVRSEHPLARWNAADLLRLGICLAEIGRTDDARSLFEDIINGTWPDDIKQQARVRRSRLP